MKNIVSWSGPNDAFSKRLDKRLRHVLRRLLSQQPGGEKRLQQERSQFVGLSQDLKLERLTKKAVALLKSRSFSIEKRNKKSLRAIRTSEQNQENIFVICTHSATKKLFDGIMFAEQFDEVPSDETRQIYYVIASLGTVPRSRFTNSLSSFEPLDDGTLYHAHQANSGPDGGTFVQVLADVKSELEFTDSFRTVLGRHGLVKRHLTFYM